MVPELAREQCHIPKPYPVLLSKTYFHGRATVMIRSLVLFTHVVGMLVLFIGLAVEWLGLESLRRATTSEHAASWVRLQDTLRRVYGIAFATLLVSGIYLARGGYFQLPWVRLAFALMALMGLTGALGGRALRSRGVGIESLQRLAAHVWLRTSLVMRAAMGLAVVYLMVGKPRLGTSLVVAVIALMVGVTISLLSTRDLPAEQRPESLQA
jgi:hypothetical protein